MDWLHGRAKDFVEGIPVGPCRSTSTWGMWLCAIQSMMEAMCIVPARPRFPFLFALWSIRVSRGSIMVRRHRGDTTPCAESLPLPTHHGEGNVLKQKMAYTTHLPPCSPILYLPCYVRNAPCGTRISLYTCHWIHNKVCLVPVPKLEPHSRTLLYTTTKVTFFTVLRP